MTAEEKKRMEDLEAENKRLADDKIKLSEKNKADKLEKQKEIWLAEGIAPATISTVEKFVKGQVKDGVIHLSEGKEVDLVDAFTEVFKGFEKIDLSENGKKIIRPGGILLSGSFIAKYIPDYRKYTADQLFGYTNENGEFVEGVIDRKILENIIGYRIPNQGLSSNDALEIVGILPEENGDTVVAYTGITTKTGSDFD